MRCTKLIPLVAVAAFLAPPPAVEAQEAPEPERYENVTWYEVVHLDFRAGKADDAMQIIEEHFVPASEAAGNSGPVMELVHATGGWDMTVIWELEDGPSAYTWETSPDGVAFMQAMAEQEGGMEAAQEVWERYSSYLARSESTLTRTPERP